MMKRMTIEVGTFAVNCSIVADGGHVWVIDPGSESGRIEKLLADDALVPEAILLTHAHFDHIGGIAGLQKRWPELPVYVHQNDMPAFGHPMNALPPDYPAAPRPKNMRSAMDFGFAEVIETPGHTPGSVCYRFVEEKLLFSGDTLFAGSVGRTDLPGGDMAALSASLKKLKALPPETSVIPGHGMFTTIADEVAGNPFMQ